MNTMWKLAKPSPHPSSHLMLFSIYENVVGSVCSRRVVQRRNSAMNSEMAVLYGLNGMDVNGTAMRASLSRCRLAFCRMSMSVSRMKSGWKYCFFSLPLADVGIRMMHDVLPHDSVRKSTIICCSPYLNEWSTIALVFVSISAKIQEFYGFCEKSLEKVWKFKIKPLPLHRKFITWSLRLSARTRDFHSLKRSSTLLGTTNKIKRNNNKDGKSQIIS